MEKSGCLRLFFFLGRNWVLVIRKHYAASRQVEEHLAEEIGDPVICMHLCTKLINNKLSRTIHTFEAMELRLFNSFSSEDYGITFSCIFVRLEFLYGYRIVYIILTATSSNITGRILFKATKQLLGISTVPYRDH